MSVPGAMPTNEFNSHDVRFKWSGCSSKWQTWAIQRLAVNARSKSRTKVEGEATVWGLVTSMKSTHFVTNGRIVAKDPIVCNSSSRRAYFQNSLRRVNPARMSALRSVWSFAVARHHFRLPPTAVRGTCGTQLRLEEAATISLTTALGAVRNEQIWSELAKRRHSHMQSLFGSREISTPGCASAWLVACAIFIQNSEARTRSAGFSASRRPTTPAAITRRSRGSYPTRWRRSCQRRKNSRPAPNRAACSSGPTDTLRLACKRDRRAEGGCP
jgi:hypothetical protein